jgi:hypothetical protein
VTIDADGMAGDTSPGGTLSWASPTAASTAQRIGCDSSATFVTLDENGEVVEAGARRRFFTSSQVLAVARDRDTCTGTSPSRPQPTTTRRPRRVMAQRPCYPAAARFTADTTALSDAVTMFASIPTPHRMRSPIAHST